MKLYFENIKLNEDVGDTFINKCLRIIKKYMKKAIKLDIYDDIDWYRVVEDVKDNI